MKRTPQSSITALLEGVEQAKLKKEFNILKDLKTLHAQYTKINKRDYTDHRSEEEKRAELDALVDELVRRQNRHAP